MKNVLILSRHGQSEWNAKNLFTGLQNPPLTPKGIEEALRAGAALGTLSLNFHSAFTSTLIRAQDTCKFILQGMKQEALQAVESACLNERDYGDLTGQNKKEVGDKHGAEKLQMWRRSYYHAPPNGESLKEIIGRVLPYYINEILPLLMQEKNVLVVSHGNTLRALVAVLDKIDPCEIGAIEIDTAVPILYRFHRDSSVKSKKIIRHTSPIA